MDLIRKILIETEEEIRRLNKEREEFGQVRIKKLKITLLGQFGLLSNSKFPPQIPLVRTDDVDAFLDGDIAGKQCFREIIKKHGLVYDELSDQIWIPPNATFSEISDSEEIFCCVLDPVFVLLSKAIKSKEKNRRLIRNSLVVFGQSLAELIVKYGGELEYFLEWGG